MITGNSIEHQWTSGHE